MVRRITRSGGPVLALAGLFLIISLAAGSPAEVTTLTVDDAVRLAVEHNLSLEAARQDYESAKWAARSARASLFPSVSLSSTVTRVDPETYRRANASLEFAEEMGIDVEPFLYETTYETGFRVSAPLWNGGRLWGAAAAAGAARDAAGHGLEARRRSVIVEAKSAYFDVLRAEALLEVSLDSADAAHENLNSARRRFDIGLVPKAEVLRWQVELAEDERAVSDAEAAVTMARTRLASVIGAGLDDAFRLREVERAELDSLYVSYGWAIEGGTLSEARARELLRGNPDFEALADATRARRAGVSAARGAFLPSLNAAGSYGWKADDDIEPDDETAWSVSLVLELPIFTSFKNLSDYQQSKREFIAAAARQEDAERSMVAALRNAASRLASSRKALEAGEELVAQAEEHLKSVGDRYAEGMAPYTEYVDARVLYDRSRVTYVNALYDGFLAVAEMERLVGNEFTGGVAR